MWGPCWLNGDDGSDKNHARPVGSYTHTLTVPTRCGLESGSKQHVPISPTATGKMWVANAEPSTVDRRPFSRFLVLNKKGIRGSWMSESQCTGLGVVFVLLSVQLFMKVGGRSLTRKSWRRLHLPHARLLRGIMLHNVYIIQPGCRRSFGQLGTPSPVSEISYSRLRR